MRDAWDVVVAGGGVAGCACGNFLAKAGLRVVILEGGKYLRHHVGESLLPASMPILEKLGVGMQEMAQRFQGKYGARFYDAARDRLAVFGFAASAAGQEERAPSFQVWRESFDALVAERAREAGCELVEGAMVSEVGEDLERPRVLLKDGRIFEGRFLVDATGRGALLAGKRKTRRDLREYGRLGIYNYFAGVAPHDEEDSRFITMYLFDGGWVWLIPLADGRTGVGIVLQKAARGGGADAASKMEGLFWEAVGRMPRLERRLAGARATEKYRAVADYSYLVTEKIGGRFVLIGDAAGFLDPIFSSGVHLALASAEQAAAGVIEKLGGDSAAGLLRYAAFMEQGYRVFEAFVERFYNRGLVDNLLFMPHKPPRFQAAITRILAGHVWERDNPVLKLIGLR